MKYKISTGETITVEDKNFAKGGEAKIYKIVSPHNYHNLVVKVYDKTIKNQKLKKIKYLINDFLFDKSAHKQIVDSIILPKHLVYDNKGNIVGFTMNIVENKITLREVLLNDLNDNYKKLKLSKENTNAFSNRLIILYNLIQAIKEIHHNHIVLCDMKPENILINKDGEVAFIDFDSVQIYSKEKNVFYPADVLTDEYAPIEKIDYKITPLNSSWDLFILGVISYQLFFRVHPYMVTDDDQLTQEEYKQKSMFAHGRFKQQLHLNPAHNDFNNIDSRIQNLFLRCLDTGCTNPQDRPSLNEWEKVLTKLISKKPINIHSWNYGVRLKVPLTNMPKPIFVEATLNHQITQDIYDATITWDIKNAKKAYMGHSLISYKGGYLPINNITEISLNDNLSIPLISTVFKFIVIDSNDDEQVFDVELDI